MEAEWTLEDLRTARGLRQSDVEEKGGPTAALISQYENGSVEPSVESLRKLARVYGVTEMCIFEAWCATRRKAERLAAGVPEKFEAPTPPTPGVLGEGCGNGRTRTEEAA